MEITRILILLFTDSECTDGDARLVRGERENNGQVEFCTSGRWGLVCRDSWDINDATVTCRQLGFDVEGIATYPCT